MGLCVCQLRLRGKQSKNTVFPAKSNLSTCTDLRRMIYAFCLKRQQRINYFFLTQFLHDTSTAKEDGKQKTQLKTALSHWSLNSTSTLCPNTSRRITRHCVPILLPTLFFLSLQKLSILRVSNPFSLCSLWQAWQTQRPRAP